MQGDELFEDSFPNPVTDYGISKLKAEQYLLGYNLPAGKSIFILRPCMIHGPGNKGNLNLLFQIIQKGLPWPWGSFENRRSLCSIENLNFVIKEIIERNDIIPSIYNVSDDGFISTNEIVKLIGTVISKKTIIYNVPKSIVNFIGRLGNMFHLPFNAERLDKLTENFVVSNDKIKKALNKKLPIQINDGLKITFLSMMNNKD